VQKASSGPAARKVLAASKSRIAAAPHRDLPEANFRLGIAISNVRHARNGNRARKVLEKHAASSGHAAMQNLRNAALSDRVILKAGRVVPKANHAVLKANSVHGARAAVSAIGQNHLAKDGPFQRSLLKAVSARMGKSHRKESVVHRALVPKVPA
jgi:hypothetical protein